MENFGDIIKQRRNYFKMSQRELARLTNLSNSTINRIEKNEAIANNDTLRVLSEVLYIDYNFLLAKNSQIDDFDDIRKIQRAYKIMNEKDRRNLMIILITFFPDKFKKVDGDYFEKKV